MMLPVEIKAKLMREQTDRKSTNHPEFQSNTAYGARDNEGVSKGADKNAGSQSKADEEEV